MGQLIESVPGEKGNIDSASGNHLTTNDEGHRWIVAVREFRELLHGALERVGKLDILQISRQVECEVVESSQEFRAGGERQIWNSVDYDVEWQLVYIAWG